MNETVRRSPDDFALTPIEKIYQEKLNALSGQEKIQRAQSLCRLTQKIMERQIRAEFGDLSPRELNYLIARKRYAGDSKILLSLERAYQSRGY